MFKKVGSGPWQVSLGGAAAVCAEVSYFPQSVLETCYLNVAASRQALRIR
jgi:hypothetical protein